VTVDRCPTALSRVKIRTGLAYPAPRIGKDAHRRGSMFGPCRCIFPDLDFSFFLGLSFVASPVLLLQVRDMQTLRIFLQRTAD
jgi:hypothetical protein